MCSLLYVFVLGALPIPDEASKKYWCLDTRDGGICLVWKATGQKKASVAGLVTRLGPQLVKKVRGKGHDAYVLCEYKSGGSNLEVVKLSWKAMRSSHKGVKMCQSPTGADLFGIIKEVMSLATFAVYKDLWQPTLL